MLLQASFALSLLPFIAAQATNNSISKPTDDCPILGPALPNDFDPSNSTAIKEAIEFFPSLIEQLFEAGSVNKTGTSFFVDVYSTQTNQSIYQYSHSAPVLTQYLTTGDLDEGTQFRIGSVSKLFTTYALLNTAGIDIFDHYVTKYIPELAGSISPTTINWSEVKVGALASQQGGTGGFPILVAVCNVLGTCNATDFLTQMRDVKRPTLPAYTTALYSDAGFGILGVVLERLTNKTYADALQSALAIPLDLTSSGSTEPLAAGLNALALPKNTSSWGGDNPITAPSGGIYSNAADLRKLGLSIMHNELLSAAETREWMKPHSHTASLTNAVGAPWEIYRLSIPVSPNSNRTRVSDLYTKLGGQVAYSAIFAISPDHGIGYNILLAGDSATSDRIPLRDLVGTVFVEAAEFAAFENAQRTSPGIFADPNDETSNMTITVDEGKPGLGLESFFIQGVDWRANITQPALDVSGDLFSIRLYPAGIEYPSSYANFTDGGVVKMYNAVAGTAGVIPRSAVEGGVGLFDDGCTQWENVGFFTASNFELEFVGGRLMKVLMDDSGVVMSRVE